jgi:hypothetical protein
MSSKELHDPTLAMAQVMEENKTRLGSYFTFHLMDRAGQDQMIKSVFPISKSLSFSKERKSIVLFLGL